jgi:hypothetical protein
MKSKGDPLGREAEVVRLGVGSSGSVAGGEGCCCIGSVAGRGAGDSLDDFVKKLGMGSAEGAGEAWKVAPAKAMLGFVVDIEAARWGVLCCASAAASGELEGLGLLLVLDRDLLVCEFGGLLLRAVDAGPFLTGV